jgi:hypothetical protein
MGFKQCSSCKGYYNANRGGCINPECVACDRAQVAKISTAPRIPKRKPKVKKTKDKGKPSWATGKLRSVKGIGAPSKEGGPSPVAMSESDSESISESVFQQSDTGYHVIYRGDTRPPAQLEKGFEAWVPLLEGQARNVIKRSQGQNFDIKLPKGAKRLETAFNKNMNLNLMTLGRQIKLEKAGDTFHISTDPTEDCGGYSSGYIYAMKFKTLYLVDKAGKVTTGALKNVRGINPQLVFDTTSLSTASIIAVVIPGQSGVEVAFLTTIPRVNIYKYRMPKSRTWYKMP